MSRASGDRAIILTENEPAARKHLEVALKNLGYAVHLAHKKEDILTCLQTNGGDIEAILLGAASVETALDTLRGVRAHFRDFPIIVLSGAPSIADVIAAMKIGATDVLCRPFDIEELARAIERASAAAAPAVDAVKLRNKSDKGFFSGTSPNVTAIESMVGKIGWSGAPVLIQGETGTGKEVLARDIHNRSPRAAKPFLKLNCAALPSELVESELFGYERGAFTGAFQKRTGMFELADGGTILLDEIGDMDVRLQAKLLQVLQDQEFRRVGGRDTVRVDVRVLAATHQDLRKAIIERTFREDLYFRLNVINIELPPLRDRKEDIIPLAEFLIRRHSTAGISIGVDLKGAMLAYSWPGNVRELENYVRKLTIFSEPDLLARELRNLENRRQATGEKAPEGKRSLETVDRVSALEHATRIKHQAETTAILEALNHTHWNRKEAAIMLHIDYKSLLYKMKKLKIENNPISLAERAGSPLRTARAAGGD